MKSSIDPVLDIKKSRLLLKHFVFKITALYGERYCTINCHNLIHLPDDVFNCGNLNFGSCFDFEDLNGELLDSLNGTQYLPSQIVNSLCLRQSLQTLSTPILQASNDEVNYLFSNIRRKRHSPPQPKERINESCFVIGSLECVTMLDIPACHLGVN